MSVQTTNNGAITTGSGLLTAGGALALNGDQTFSGTTARNIIGPGTGGLTLKVTSGPLAIQTLTSGNLSVASAGTLSLSGVGASTWDINGTLSLQTTNNGAITTGTGLLTAAGGLTVSAGKTLTLSSGSGQILQTFTGTTTDLEQKTATALTTGKFLNFVQNTGAYTGTAIFANIAAGSGTFASGNFIDLQKNSVSQFSVSSTGLVSSTTGYSVGGTAGATSALCATSNYIGNGVKLTGGIITAGSCQADGVSDRRLKKNITGLDSDALAKINEVNTVTFDFRCDEPQFANSGMNCHNGRQTGVIAQELAQIFPDLVYQDENGYYNVKYQGLSIYTIKAVQDLSKEVTTLASGNFVSVNASDILANTIVSDVVATHYTQAEAVSAGDVVALDTNGNLRQATSPFQKGLIGVVVNDRSGSSQVAVATAGKAMVKVSGPVTVGDLLTSSGVAGVAQVANGSGPIIGVATTSFSGTGQGSVIMAVQNSQAGGSGSSDPALQNQVNALSTSVDQIKAGLVGADGQPVNFGNLQLGALHIGLDTIADGGLTVGGDAEFKGTALFDQLVTFGAPVNFKDDVTFNGNASFNNNTGGYAVINAGRTSVHVVFTKAYATAPIISLTKGDATIGSYHYENVTATGFDIVLDQVNTQNVHLSWLAVSINGANTFVQQ